MKLGKNTSDICTILSEAYGGETMKSKCVFGWHKWFKENSHTSFPQQAF